MKKIILFFVAALLLAATVPTAARAAGNGSGTLSVDKNNVSVSLSISGGKTKTITSLRVQLRVSVTSGTMDQPDFTFDSSIPSTVKSAAVKKDGSAYMVGSPIDAIISSRSLTIKAVESICGSWIVSTLISFRFILASISSDDGM